MKERTEIKFCWSCGKIDNSCQCGSEAQIIAFKPPIETLPSCAANTTETPLEFAKLKIRECCSCGKSWNTTGLMWVSGSCPSCGASGADGKLAVKIDKKPGTKTNPQTQAELSGSSPDANIPKNPSNRELREY